MQCAPRTHCRRSAELRLAGLRISAWRFWYLSASIGIAQALLAVSADAVTSLREHAQHREAHAARLRRCGGGGGALVALEASGGPAAEELVRGAAALDYDRRNLLRLLQGGAAEWSGRPPPGAAGHDALLDRGMQERSASQSPKLVGVGGSPPLALGGQQQAVKRRWPRVGGHEGGGQDWAANTCHPAFDVRRPNVGGA